MPAAVQREDRLRHARAKYEKRVREARTDLATYIELCAKDANGEPVELSQIHRSWIWHVDYCWSRGKHALILAPFGSGKSSGFAVPLATWLVGKNPQERLKFVSNADDFAKQRVQGAKMIMESAEYRDVFPEIRRGTQWSDSKLFVRRLGNALDPSIHARGVMTKGVGGRADHIIFDDVCDQLNTESQALRGRVKGFARSTWMSRLEQPAGLALMIATAWHPDDATQDFLQDPLWCSLVQAIKMPDMLEYEQTVFGAGSDYLEGLPPGV